MKRKNVCAVFALLVMAMMLSGCVGATFSGLGAAFNAGRFWLAWEERERVKQANLLKMHLNLKSSEQKQMVPKNFNTSVNSKG